ncbi:winged helix-turn-helix domain-containing protein [Bradyrhizobium elkanii]
MAFSFGLFELDEAGRVLLCARQEVPLQPRVFDLLIYLVRHRERVISKEELLEAVWPDVTVTDNSLQRAVSALRAALRNGGMDGAIRNLPGKGYRFFLESEIRQPERIDPKQVDGTVGAIGAIGLARRAAAGQLWLQAATLFASADESGQLNAEDFHDWALALQCLGRATAAIPILVRAVAARSQAGDAAGATVDAIALSALHFESGQAAIGKGWLARAEDWASTLDDPPTTALVLWMKSKLAAFDGEPEQALALADAAYTAVRYKDAINIEALSLAYRGFYRLCLGDTHGGLADQDHAAAVALSSNNLDPIMGGQPLLQHPLGSPDVRRLGTRRPVDAELPEFLLGQRHGVDGLMPAAPLRGARHQGLARRSAGAHSGRARAPDQRCALVAGRCQPGAGRHSGGDRQ